MRELVVVLGLLLVGVAATAEQPASTTAPPQKVDLLEARLADVIRRANEHERLLFRTGLHLEQLAERVKQLEASERGRRKPMGLTYYPPFQLADGSWSGGRLEVIWTTQQDAPQ